MLNANATHSRRAFLGRVAATAWVGAFLETGRDPILARDLASLRSNAAAAATDNEAFWTGLQSKFLFEPGLVYLNAGTTGAMPRAVVEAESRYQHMLAENPRVRSHFEQEVVPTIVRQKAADLLGASLDETALTHNTTEGLNIVANGLPLKAGDHVIITDQEHPGHREPWRLRAKREGLELTLAEIPIPLPNDAVFVDAMSRHMTPRTKVIGFPLIPTTVGMITPAKKMCAVARSKGIWTVVDGAHASGQIRVNVKDLGCDFFATSPHKWLHAPLGNGIFYARKEMQDTLWPLTGAAGWDTFHDARKYSAFGNRSWATATALGDAIDFANAIGIDKIEARLRFLTTHFKKRLLSMPGVDSLSPNDEAMYCGMSAYRIGKIKPSELVAYLKNKHKIIVAGKTQGIRVDISYYITPRQLDAVLDVLDGVMRGGVPT
ncbi:MAG TPA: aminotransferase class V-fold PLP-dependent enzyme [Vicinamibacterales bacterium]|jgi:selenocysteine lyase/cysteine desulfurase